MAAAVMRAAVTAGKIEVHVASQEKPTAWVEIGEEAADVVVGGAAGMDQLDLALG
jgi:hypothetical protein